MTQTKKISASKGKTKTSYRKKVMGNLSRIGKALLVPIAVLPLAAILLRVGPAIPETTAFSKFISQWISAGGNVVFNNLHILFAVGIAFGLTKERRGEAALAGFIGIVLLTLLMKQGAGGADFTNAFYGKLTLAGGNADGFASVFGGKYNPILANNVLNGFVSGLIIAGIYNKFHDVELPKVLSFFGGRRLIVVLAISSIMLFALVWAIVFPWIGFALYKFSDALGQATSNRYGNAAIMGVYGIINRLLIPLGLHHIPNTLFWFSLGNFQDANGALVNGDINGFLSGASSWVDGAGKTVINTAGTFQTGFFPMMMFGLPALVAAIWVTSDNKEQRNKVIAMMGGAAIISFLTGITEPIEFAFLFAAPALFGLHALATGLFAFITGLFGIQLGFGFSAGLIDYGLSIPKSMEIIKAHTDTAASILADPSQHWSALKGTMANPGWVWVIGAAQAATYFFGGKYAIKKFNIATPGRGVNQIGGGDTEEGEVVAAGGLSTQGRKIIEAFGGWSNITEYSNCTTRLRYDVKDASKVNDAALKKAGAIGVVRPSPKHIQVIIGTHVESLNQNITSNKGATLSAIKPVAKAKTATKPAAKAKPVAKAKAKTATKPAAKAKPKAKK